MKIALISPRGNITNNKVLLKIWEKTPEASAYRDSLLGIGTGLLTVAALLPKSFEIKFIDENYEEIDFSKKYDLVAIGGMTQQATRAYEIADKFRIKKVKVVLGGIHPTVMPQEAEQHADSVVVGEGENVWPALIKDFLSNNLKKRYVSNIPVDLTKSPMPRFDLLNPKNYKIIWIQSTRGCPRDCEFCAVTRIYGSKCRHKTIEQVVNEIKAIKKLKLPFKIGFADDNMFIDRKYAKNLIQAIKPLNVRWFAQTDISIGEDPELLRLLREANCMTLFIGFESISKRVLETVDKYGWKLKQLKNYAEAIRKIQANGMGIVGSFIVGLDGDDVATFDELADFIIKQHIYAVQITVPTPLPGTRLREKFINEHRLLNKAWQHYTFTDINFIPKSMTPAQLKRGLEKVYKKVYSVKVGEEKRRYLKGIYSDLLNKEISNVG